MPAATTCDVAAIQHPDVHHDHVGVCFLRDPHGVGPGTGLADDFDVRRVGDEDPEAGPDQRLIVGEDHTPRHQAAPAIEGVGSVAATRNPPPGRCSAVNVPSSSSARSRMPTMP